MKKLFCHNFLLILTNVKKKIFLNKFMQKDENSDDDLNAFEKIANKSNTESFITQDELDIKSEEFQNFKDAISDYLKIEENNVGFEDQVAMLEYISNNVSKLTNITCKEAFPDYIASYFIDRFIESTPSDIRMSLLLNILSEIVWYLDNPVRMVEDDFIDKINDVLSNSTGDIKRSASTIFYYLLQLRIWNEKITASQNLELWDKIDDIDIKLESFRYLIYEKDSLLDYNLILQLLKEAVNLFVNSTISPSFEALKVALVGFSYYLDLNKEWTRRHSNELSEIFNPYFMQKLTDLIQVSECSKKSILLFNNFITYNINDEEIFNNVIPIINSIIFSQDSTEKMKINIFYFWARCISKGCDYFGDSDFTQNVMNEISNSPYKVKKAALSLLYTAYQYHPELSNELIEDNFEIFFELLEQADEFTIDDTILILTRIMDIGNPEITQFITDYSELDELKEILQDVEINSEFDEETHNHARILLEFLEPKTRSYDLEF